MRLRENLNSIYILLFLNVVFFFLHYQDPQRYLQAFAFLPEAVMSGEVWRVFTYQFAYSGPISLFFTLLILYIMGSAVEEELGSAAFVGLFFLSTLATAGVAFTLGQPLIGSLFFDYSLLFIFAHLYPEQVFYLMFVLPVKVKWLAWLALAMLGLGVILLQPGSLAAAGGAAITYGWYRFGLRRGERLFRRRAATAALQPQRPPATAEASTAAANVELFRQVREAAAGGPEQKQQWITRLEPGVVPGVNICPPVDYKPEAPDLYCVRCEGFNECTIRYLRLSEAPRSEAPKEDAKRSGQSPVGPR